MDFKAILDKHSLKKTDLRRAILEVLSSAREPMSQAALIQSLQTLLNSVDRVSVYRNLGQLKKVGLVHEVEGNSYVFCSHECDQHAHLLLFCQKCHAHQEIKDHKSISDFMGALKALDFLGIDEPVFIKGVCKQCSVGSARKKKSRKQ